MGFELHSLEKKASLLTIQLPQRPILIYLIFKVLLSLFFVTIKSNKYSDL